MDEVIAEIEGTWRSAGRYERAHWSAAEKRSRAHLWMGSIGVVLSSIVAASVFTTVSQNHQLWLKVLTGIIAVSAGVATALVTFLADEDRAKRHQTAGAEFARVRRRLHLLLLEAERRVVDTDGIVGSLSTLVDELTSVQAASPGLSEREYRKGMEGFDRHYPIEVPELAPRLHASHAS